MKVKRFDKKLSLKRETISNLNGESLSALKGGASNTLCVLLTEKCFIKSIGCNIELSKFCVTRQRSCNLSYCHAC